MMMSPVHFSPRPAVSVCPFHMTMAFAENANVNGVSFFLNTKVTSIKKEGEGYSIETLHTDTNATETFTAKVVINAARGLCRRAQQYGKRTQTAYHRPQR